MYWQNNQDLAEELRRLWEDDPEALDLFLDWVSPLKSLGGPTMHRALCGSSPFVR